MRYLRIVIIVLVFALLFGARFGMSWAGKSGIAPKTFATLSETRAKETGESVSTETEVKSTGDVLKTDDAHWKTYALLINDVTSQIFLAENTEVKILPAENGHAVLQLLQGRMVAKGTVTVRVRDTEVTGNEETAYAFYSWKDSLEYANISGETTVFQSGQEQHLPEMAYTLDTYPPYDRPEPFTFDPERSSAAAFYAWSLTPLGD